MNGKTVIYILIAIVAVVLLQFYQYRKRNEAFNSLLKHLNNQDYEGFDRECETALVKSFIPPYNLSFLKLNAALMRNDKSRIEDTIATFDAIKMNITQKQALYDKCFFYYISTENKDKAQLYYQLLMDMNNTDKVMYSCFYDTYVLKGCNYLDEVLNRLSSLNDNEKIPYYTLLADIYRNKGDDDNANKYTDLLKKQLNKN